MDGFAFSELSQRQGSVASQREELEKQRKLLGKRRPSPGGASSQSGESSRLLAAVCVSVLPPSFSYTLCTNTPSVA